MDLSEHLLYQEIIKYHNSYDCILNSFIKALKDHGHSDIPEITSKNKSEDAAKLIAMVFNALPPADIQEYINHGRKAKIARSLIHLLNSQKYNSSKIKSMLEEFSRIPAGSIHLSTTMTLDIRVNLITQFISNHLAYVSIAKNYINMRDIANVLEKSVSVPSRSGTVGGKAAGMLLANHILKPSLNLEQAQKYEKTLADPESWFIRSSIISEFVADNQLEECHSLKYLEGEEFETEYEILAKRFMNGYFSSKTIKYFKHILSQTIGTPLILRSSSFLEDGVNCSFTGKYDSFFISNCGTEKERLDEFTNAIKKVYLSIYGASVIQYRKDRSLLDFNEKMSVLVQKVVGKKYGKYFFPMIGIVGFSRNPYCWNSKIKPEDGMLRMVMGLGTRAVDRVGDDYPRIVSLSAPNLRPEGSGREQMRYSQKYVDVMNLETRDIETLHFVDLANYLLEIGAKFPFRDIISIEKDGVLAPPMFKPDRYDYETAVLTFDGLLKKKLFTETVKEIFNDVRSAYKTEVDMEFAYDNDHFYVLQCRPLFNRNDISSDSVIIPNVKDERTLFRLVDTVRSAAIDNIEYAIYVDYDEYKKLSSMEEMYEVARIVGKVNKHLANKRFIIMGPGRWGTNSPELGISVKYADINNSLILVEVGFDDKDGKKPELSYGTHFFQDLVEANIIPLPLFPDADGYFFNKEIFNTVEPFIDQAFNVPEKYKSVVKVLHIPTAFSGDLLHVRLNSDSANGIAFIAPTVTN